MKQSLKYFIITFCLFLAAACSPDEEIITQTPSPSPLAFALSTPTTIPTAILSTPPRLPEQAPPPPQPDIPLIVAEIDLGEGGNIVAGLADGRANRLYVLSQGGMLHILQLDDYAEVAQVETGLDRSHSYGPYIDPIALDAGRNRLYLSGEPLQILNTNTFQLTTRSDLRGHITSDPTTDRLYLTPPCFCRLEQCNTLILNANTLTGTQTLFPRQDPFVAPCVIATSLDAENQLLQAHINNGVAGSNGGFYFSFFDVSSHPQLTYTDNNISFGSPTFDPVRRRAYLPRWRMDMSAIHRYSYQGQLITSSQALVGLAGQLAYDPIFDRLYAVQSSSLFTFDGDLTLLSEVPLPDRLNLLSFDPQRQRLYLAGSNGKVIVVATSGGALQPPPEPDDAAQAFPRQRLVAPDGTHFRIFGERLYRSEDGGQTWQILGRGLPAHPVSTMAVSPNYAQDRTLLAGLNWSSSGAGLYRSADNGDTWQPTTAGLTDLAVTIIAFSPTFPRDQTIFAAAHTQGLFRSTDGGDNWVGLAATYADHPSEGRISQLALSPTFADDNLLIISSGALHLSVDGGNTWTDTQIPGGLIAFSPAFAEDRLVLSAGRWRSIDGGQTWRAAASGLAPTSFGAISLHFSPDFAADQTVYLLLDRGYDASPVLHRSTDAGRSWQMLLGGLPSEIELGLVTPLPGDRLILTATNGQEMIVPAQGLEWGRAPVDLADLDLQALAIAPDGTLFVANSTAGVYRSTDEGRTWVETNFPGRGSAVERAHLALAQDGTLFAAVGPVIARTTDAGANWTQLSGLPTGFEIASLALSPGFTTDEIVIAGGNYTRNDLIRSGDMGESWSVVFEGAQIEGGSEIVALAFSPDFTRNGVVYAWLQNSGLLRSTDGSLTWDLLANDDSRFYAVQSLAVAPDGERLYLGALDGRFLVSADEGQSWADLSENIPDQRIWSSAIAFDSTGIFLGTDIGVYQAADEGQTWRRASAGLPTQPGSDQPQGVRALKLNNGQLYAALTAGGLFISGDGGQSWRNMLLAAAVPTPTTMSASTPTVEPVVCAIPPIHFADLWADRVAQLGCPLADGSRSNLLLAEQSFSGGHMFWRSDTADIYVLPVNQPYVRLPDTWEPSQAEYSCPNEAPSQTPPTPKRGFGVVWCQQPQLRQQLGNATDEEHLVEVKLQEFEFGLIFGLNNVAYILDDRSGEWEKVGWVDPNSAQGGLPKPFWPRLSEVRNCIHRE